MGFLLNGVESGGIPVGIVEALLSAGHQVRTLVETGSAGGQSVKDVANLFDKIYTIELIEGRYEQSLGNVKAITGDSPKVLNEIRQELSGFVLFYLDAHYSGDIKNPLLFQPECPLLEEIEVISRYDPEKCLIIIDDARLFYGPPPDPLDPRQWPSLKEIFDLLREKFIWHHITIRDDYIICVPIHFLIPLDQEWRDRYHIRYPNAADKLKTEVKNAWYALKYYLND